MQATERWVACARPKCEQTYDGTAAYPTSYMKAGYCSSKCQTLVHNGNLRKIENNGGIVPGSADERLLRNENFSLWGSGVGRKKWTNGVASIEPARGEWEVVGAIKVSATQVARRVIKRIRKDTEGALAEAIALCKEQRPAHELEAEIANITRPREAELKSLDELRNELVSRIQGFELKMTYEQINLRSGKSLFPLQVHADIIAAQGAVIALKRELAEVEQRIKDDLPPSMSPVAPHGVIADEQLQAAGGHSWRDKWRHATLHGTGHNTDPEWNS